MTTFGAPPYPPPVPAMYGGPAPQDGPAPWSAAAIAAFVLALLGFIGVTAVLALLFAVVAFFTTRGGRRRGLGLAVAAIPISLLTGAISAVIFAGLLVWGQMMEVPAQLETVFNSGGDTAAQVVALRELTSTDFDESVDDRTLSAWLDQVRSRHGGLTSLKFDAQNSKLTPEGAMRMTLKGKFVNGAADIGVVFDREEIWSGSITDIEVDGSSPRKPISKEPAATPP